MSKKASGAERERNEGQEQLIWGSSPVSGGAGEMGMEKEKSSWKVSEGKAEPWGSILVERSRGVGQLGVKSKSQ